MNITPTLLIDGYKSGHIFAFPRKTEKIYSNLTARMTRDPEMDFIVAFGMQGFSKEILIEEWTKNFFSRPREEVVTEYQELMDAYLGPGQVPADHIGALHDLGYLPIRLKALPEGTVCPIKVPVLTITNTRPEFFWLTNYLETVLSCYLWQPMTSATQAFIYRRILERFAKETSDIPEFVPWQIHDFSMRGQTSPESAMRSGAGHLLSSFGTDTIPALPYLRKYYGADYRKELVGGSVPATEHAIVCMGGFETEEQTFERLITEVVPKGIVSLVSDTWDYWGVLTKILPKLRDKIMARDGKVVIRPDSGDPVKVLCGDLAAPRGSVEFRGTIEQLWDVFGGTVNSKGFKQLDPHIGAIYGDSITRERCHLICQGLKEKGFASTNVVYGVGSYTYQYVTRDTLGIAMKATHGVIDGKPVDIYKDPKTDSGFKKSAKGLLSVKKNSDTGKLVLLEQQTEEGEKEGYLQTVFLDGKMVHEETLADIRKRLLSQL